MLSNKQKALLNSLREEIKEGVGQSEYRMNASLYHSYERVMLRICNAGYQCSPIIKIPKGQQGQVIGVSVKDISTGKLKRYLLGQYDISEIEYKVLNSK